MNLAAQPNVERKLVAGKLVYVINDLPSHRLTASSVGRNRSPGAIQPPPLADKPNNVDPRDWERLLAARFGSPRAPSLSRPEAVVPEKSDLQRSDRSDFEARYRVLPQIGGSSNGHDDAHHHVAHHAASVDDLFARLPNVTELPSTAIDLSPDEERLLVLEVAREVQLVDPGALKDVYTHLAGMDSNLDGVTDLFNVQLALSRYKIFLPPNLLRLVAARFISSRFAGKVNYERLISFLGVAMKTARSPRHQTYRRESPLGSPRSHDGRFQQQQQHYDEGHYDSRSHRSMEFGEQRGVAALVHQLKHNRALQNFPIEWLRANFQRTDALHRGTLSEHQIKDIAYHCGLPVDEYILTKLIHCCHYRGGGQFDWQDFIGFLERVGQQATGLDIPRSRRPLEMARQSYEPSSDWPHATQAFTARTNGVPPLPLGRTSQASSHGEHGRPMYREPSPPPQRLPTEAKRRSEFYNQLEYQPPEEPPQPMPTSQSPQFASQEPPEPETKTIPPPNALSRENILKESWLNRFVRLADTLYDADTTKCGFLDRSKLLRLIHDYNAAYFLDLSSADIDREVNACTRTSTDRADYHVVLRKLAALRS